MTGDHSSKQYDADLEGIRSKVLLMGGMVEQQFQEAMSAFSDGNTRLAEKVIADDDHVNALEVELDDACCHLIVRRQPTANDLRTVMATIKIITDLERIGDESSKIARTSMRMTERAGIKSGEHFKMVNDISDRAAAMLRGALDALARLDEKQALALIADDTAIDIGFRTITRSLATYMMEDPRTISSSVDTMWVAKAIERVGDHAKNIAEFVVYVVGGKDIRHSDFATADKSTPA
jgi:phosphate transport system protein